MKPTKRAVRNHATLRLVFLDVWAVLGCWVMRTAVTLLGNKRGLARLTGLGSTLALFGGCG